MINGWLNAGSVNKTLIQYETRLHKMLCEPDKPDQILHCIHSIILEMTDLGAEMHAITWHHQLSFHIQ